MPVNPGPNYREWVQILEHNKAIGFEELRSLAKRIEGDTRLTEAQRGELLRRLGDLQVAAANRTSSFTHHEVNTGPAGS